MTTSPAQRPQGCTTTSIEGTVQEAPLPNPSNKPYLLEKANYAVRFPRVSLKRMPNGQTGDMTLKQVVMSGLIRADEYLRDFHWDYKAEVSFDMTRLPPTPFLSTSETRPGAQPDPDRRHSLNPFPSGRTRGLLRRPDVIIVKDRNIRWPGRAGADHLGTMHPDNLERVVEVKFPGDKLWPDQRRAYLRIAGERTRLSILEIRDCRDESERERDHQINENQKPTANHDPLTWPPLPSPEKTGRPYLPPLPVPIYGPYPIPRPARVENWTQQIRETIDSLLEESGLHQLSAEVQHHLKEAAIWLGEKGQWLRNRAGDAWEWVSETGATVLRWTDQQLRAIWREIQHYTDLTLEMLGKIDWLQVLVDIGVAAGSVVVVFLVAGALATAGVPAALLSGLVLLVRLAQLSWAWLASILGAGAVAGALASN